MIAGNVFLLFLGQWDTAQHNTTGGNPPKLLFLFSYTTSPMFNNIQYTTIVKS